MPSFKSIRRQVLWNLNSRYIYGRYLTRLLARQPLLHTLVFITELIMVSFLVSKFNSYYAARPVLTTMVTNAILGGVADTVAQSLTAVRERAVRKPGGPDPNSDQIAIEIHEVDRRIHWPEEELIPDSKVLPPPFDFERLTRFMAYGFIMAPIQHKWFGFLSRIFPLTKTSGTVAAAKRTAFDQLIFAPVGLGAFFTFMTVAEGGGRKQIQKKFQDIYIPSLKANYLVWPAVQLINFRLMPRQFQIPFVSTIGIAWTAYLSLTNSAEEA
ncbi:hypothetical protein D6C98_03807 [Aureobasidium pullulans]|uniref:Integral membrane protein, Mpv17/PMP22 family n=2 Tax=Aureobasidium pullulans TaxID=5580 RepID=A0A4S8ZYD1_AURPU|nr:hypothetical protein D6D22_06940 [Aureobasidium pullulans]THW71383.1 hypothetical protein D6D25_00141 [Aureobasidium pullulans]THX61452.1 hypothetical protein D6D11_02802 [Aureobasidium pullulans]THX85832.1 hypothetical protein D6D08_04306 [Aureobasidium pullulans]THY01301.1 hypothetical protein D6D03_05886 [Aureobasidium pullulans]